MNRCVSTYFRDRKLIAPAAIGEVARVSIGMSSIDASQRIEQPRLTPSTICDALRGAGIDVTLSELRIDARDERYAVSLPGLRMAWFPTSAKGRERLAVERRILRLLAARCSFQAPRILLESDAGWDIRTMVPGLCDPWALHERTKTDISLARRIGRTIGSVLAEQHTRIHQADVAGWLPDRPGWPESSDWIRRRLPSVIDDACLVAEIDGVLRRYDDLTIAPGDRVLVHGDLGFHNISIDPATAELCGVFDYDGAGWADRHHDFRYLIFDLGREDALEAGLAAYQAATGCTLSRHRIRFYNAVCAISFLAFRCGVAPDQRWCGRTLAEDLGWVRGALASGIATDGRPQLPSQREDPNRGN
jgi:aminoglycoside phosphotransferase (APT) family kinase protein